MRIIDKNNDFYDYVSYINYDDSLVFDRTNSFELTEQNLINSLPVTSDMYQRTDFRPNNMHYLNYFILLQVCNKYWLFLIQGKIDPKKYKYNFYLKDYEIKLLKTWSNYDNPKKLISLDHIRIKNHYFGYNADKSKIEKSINDLVYEINHNNYESKHNFCHNIRYKQIKNSYIKFEETIPLLKSSGLAKFIDPMEFYLALEEYFSLEKTANERRESIGLTNKEKIENHGFDIKTSFRGKN